MARLIECVPNFSEGRDPAVINSIVDAIREAAPVQVLDVDPGQSTNRTVVTFAGEPEAVVEAAFAGVARAQQLIDMRKHHGAHPRIGATDVLPLIPIEGVSLEECAEMARALAKRIADELGVPTFCYEAAALRPERKNLAAVRAGEYEGLAARMGTADAPDFGGDGPMTEAVARSGATVVGARDFLIAVNFNLNTTSTRRANAIAFDVREKGRPLRQGPKVTDKPVIGDDGKPVMVPGTLPGTKAIGWFIDEYQIAQVSMNITDTAATPLHVAFEEVCRAAAARGVRVTGTEIVGMVPRRCLIEAGKYFLRKQQRSLGVSDDELIREAIISMGLSELKPFVPEERIIESIISPRRTDGLTDLTLRAFAQATASESPAPGGGSVAAYMGTLAAALGTMVANLSAHKPGWDDRWEEFSDAAERGQQLLKELLELVDEDTAAFNRVMEAFKMPKVTAEEKAARTAAIQAATLGAAQVPLRTMRAALKAFPLLRQMALDGNPASASDAGVGALAARAAVLGAELNVKINVASLTDSASAQALLDEAKDIAAEAVRSEADILEIVNSKI